MKNLHKLSDRLNNASLFKGISQKALSDVLDMGFRKSFKEDENLFNQGDKAQSVFLLLSGRVKLIQTNQNGEEVLLRYLMANDLAAIVAVLRKKAYPATAECVQPGEAICWDGISLRNLMQKHADIAINALDITLDRLEEFHHRFLDMTAIRVEQRIARTLLRLMKRGGKNTEDGILIDFPLSRQNIAEHAGTTLYTVSRVLSAWEKANYVKSTREKIIIKDAHSLVIIADDIG